MQRKLMVFVFVGFVILFTGAVALADNVTFQVNMNRQMELENFSAEHDLVGLRGGFNDWSGTEPQLTDDNGDGIYSATVSLDNGSRWDYKFIIFHAVGGESYEDGDNRNIDVGDSPQTLDPVWFSNDAGATYMDVLVNFVVDMGEMRTSGQFNPENDLVVVRGGHDVLGNWGGMAAVLTNSEGDFYDGSFLFENYEVGASTEYKFVVLQNENPDTPTWEPIDNRSFTVSGEEPDENNDGVHELMLPSVAFGNMGSEDFTTEDVNVVFAVDMRPAYYKLDDPTSGGINDVESIESVQIAGDFNGWSWQHFDPNWVLYDNGVEPDDVAGDSIFTVAVHFNAGSNVEQIYKYAINGLDVEAGYGENHVIQLDEETDPNFTHDNFGEPGSMYDPWIYWILPLRDYEVLFTIDMNPFVDAGLGTLDTMTVGVRGSVPELGNWGQTTIFIQVEENVYSGWIQINDKRPGNDIEYKFLAEGPNSMFWEVDPNRVFSIQGEELDSDSDGLLEIYLETAAFRIGITPTSIHDIQYVEDPAVDDASPFESQTVTVEGWVTFDPASGSRTRFFMADAPGPWNGIYVYSPNGTPRMGCGWYVRVTGEIQEYYGLTELAVADLNDIQVLYTGIYWGDPPTATEYTVVSAADLQNPATAEQYEGVLIRVEDVVTTAEPGEFGEWSVADASGNSLVVDNPMDESYGYYHAVKMNQPFDYVQGPLNYSYSEYKILPEIAHDLNVAVDPENSWFDSVPYIQQVKWHDIVVHRNEGVDEYRYDQSYASDTRYNNYDMSEQVTVLGVVTLEPGIGHAGTGGTKFLIADPFIGIDENNELRSWSGVVVYASNATVVPELEVGDLVQVTGYVSEYVSGPSHLTEIILSEEPGMVQVVGELDNPPLPKSIGLGQVWDYWYAEKHEGVIVHTGGGVVTDNSNENLKQLFLVDDENDEVPAVQITGDCADFRDENYVRPAVGTNILSITGWIENNWGMLTPQTEYDNIFRLNPRYLSDVEIEGGGGEPYFTSVESTGLPYAIVVASASMGEGALNNGDEIAVFDGELCVGAAIVDGYPVAITAWQGDPSHELAGFTAGNDILFRVYVTGEEREYPATASYIAGDGTYGFGSGSNVDLEVQLETTLQQEIQGGRYELISVPVMPADLSTEYIFDGFDNLQIVYADNGNFYWPDASVDNIEFIDVTEGYRVFISNTQTMEISGMPLDPSTEYSLAAGRWNWMGYPFLEEHDAVSALSGISDQMIIIQNDDGLLWWPDASVNTIGNLVPGTGYQIFVTDDVTFTFNAGIDKQSAPLTQIVALPDAPASTGLPYAVMVNWDDTLEEMGVSAVELYDGDLLVGKGAPLEERQAALVTAWGGDEAIEMPGFRTGQPIKVRLIGEDGLELPLKSDVTTAKYGEGAGAIVSVERVDLPTEFSVSAGYPNPFNPSITIPFGLPKGGEVTFTMYNLLGQRVMKETQTLQAGYHRHFFRAQPGMVSGVYFLRVDFEHATRMQKIMLLK